MLLIMLIAVLILVLMEDTLREKEFYPWRAYLVVLILVLMEDTLRAARKVHSSKAKQS